MKNFLLTSAVLFLATASHATTITYTTQSSYEAATVGNTTVTFPATFAAFIPPSVTRGGVVFSVDTSTSNGDLYYVDNGGRYGSSAVLSSQQSNTGHNNLVILLPGFYTSFSLLFNSFTNTSGTFAADPLTVVLSDGDSFTSSPVPDGSYVFTGLTSTQSFNSIKIVDSDRTSKAAINLAQLEFGTAAPAVTGSPVPEPSSIGLLVLGFVSMALFSAFTKRNTQQTQTGLFPNAD